MTGVNTSGLIISSGRKKQLPANGIAEGKIVGRIRTLSEVAFIGQSVGVHTNGTTYTYDGVPFTAARTDTNGQSEITTNGLKLSRTASSVSPNYHALLSYGDSGVGGWLYQTIGLSRFIMGNWQFWVRYTNINIGSMSITFANTEMSGGYPYHGIAIRRTKTSISAPATQGGNSFNIYGPTTESITTMGSGDTGYQYDTLCIQALSPCLFMGWAGQYSGGWPDLDSMVLVGTANFLSSSYHVGRGGTTSTTFLRDLKLWHVGFSLGGTNVGDYTVERTRITEFA